MTNKQAEKHEGLQRKATAYTCRICGEQILRNQSYRVDANGYAHEKCKEEKRDNSPQNKN